MIVFVKYWNKIFIKKLIMGMKVRNFYGEYFMFVFLFIFISLILLNILFILYIFWKNKLEKLCYIFLYISKIKIVCVLKKFLVLYLI